MTDNTRALLEQALEALELGFEAYDAFGVERDIKAIQALRAELAKPVEPIPTGMAVERLCQALHDDLDYAWSWHCNVAMSAHDAGCPHDVANEGAARFMQLLAGVDTREHFAFSGTQTKVDLPTPAWHDAPTEPGNWWGRQKINGKQEMFVEITQREIDSRPPWFPKYRWYGPIPQDIEKAESST